MSIAPFRTMWTFVMFDLPVKSKQDRREYTKFRQKLLKLGLVQLQYSIYAKAMPSEDAVEHLASIVHMALPPRGDVRILKITDRQFGKMEVYSSRKSQTVEDDAEQISLF